MEELTLLVQLAGGELDAVRRLRQAGFGTAKDLAAASVDELSAASGLAPAATRRLIRCAKDELESKGAAAGETPTRGLGTVLADVGGGAARGATKSHAAWESVPNLRTVAPAGEYRDPTAEQAPAAAGDGVSREESHALTGKPRLDKPAAVSFWRFG